MGKDINRRNFIKILGATTGVAAISLSPIKAYAWMGYEFAGDSPLWQLIGFNEPIHEDFLQFAYSIVLQRHKESMTAGQGPTSLINPANKFYNGETYTPNQYFLENLKMLRYGAYWNDAAAFNPLDFITNQICKNAIIDWNNQKNPTYKNIDDIAEHIEQNNDGMFNTFTQFSANGRLDCIHGMLNCYALGPEKSGRFSQKDNKTLILEWFKHAYKFAVEGQAYPQSNIKALFDTNNQYDASLDSQSKIDDSGSFTDTNETKYNTRQLRLRVLGMICHTIQDLWNPAHTIRSYCTEDTNDSERFGKILAFGDYSKQSQGLGSNNHKAYDLCSDIETSWDGHYLREILINETTPHQGKPERIPQESEKNKFLDNILSWNGSKHSKNINIATACKEFKTLGLKYCIKFLSDFLEIAYLNFSWINKGFYYNNDINNNDSPIKTSSQTGYTYYNSVEDWFKTFVLKSLFDINGDSYIYDGGIKTTLTDYAITPHVKNLEETFSSLYGTKGEALNELLYELIELHKQYVSVAKDFYKNRNINGSDYLQDIDDCKAKTTQKSLFNLLKKIFLEDTNSFKTLIKPNIEGFLYNLNVKEYASWANLVDVIAGFLQELYLEADNTHQINDDVQNLKSSLKGEIKNITITGDVENTWTVNKTVHLILRCEDGELLYFFADKSTINNPNNLVLGAKNIKVECDLGHSIYNTGVFMFMTTNINAPALDSDFDSSFHVIGKIIKQNTITFTAEILDFSANGKSTYTFTKYDSSINVKDNMYYLIEYTTNNNMLVCKKASEYSDSINTNVHSSKIVSTYSNCLEYLVKMPLPDIPNANSLGKKELEESDLLFFNEAQISGDLKPNENVKFIFSSVKLDNKTESDNIGYGYKEAVKIVNDNYNKDGSMNLYLQNGKNTHIKTDKKLNSSTIEPCNFKNGTCIHCGAKELNLNSTKTPDTSDKYGPVVTAAVSAAAMGAAGLISEGMKD